VLKRVNKKKGVERYEYLVVATITAESNKSVRLD